MNIIHATPSMASTWGGPTSVLNELSARMVQKQNNVVICTAKGGRTGIPDVKPAGVTVKSAEITSLGKFWTGYSSEISKLVYEACSEADIIHIHEFWHYVGFSAYKAAKFFNKPYVISIHGALSPWALAVKKTFKKAYSRIIMKKMLVEASAIHCLTADEAFQLSDYGINNITRVIPNGVNPPSRVDKKAFRRYLDQRYPNLNNKIIIVFLGRIHKGKGLDLLAEAFGELLHNHGDEVRLLMIGPDEGYKETVQDILAKYNATDKCIFSGQLTGYDKTAFLGGSDIFTLPSYSEGFSMAVLEAMAVGLPVIISDHCHFPEVVDSSSGVIIDANVTQLLNALKMLVSDSSLRNDMGVNGRELALEKFTWDIVTEKMLALYQDILDRTLR